jgi:glycosyltransferase involved in cell wall biosynthesis/thymidylate kinase
MGSPQLADMNVLVVMNPLPLHSGVGRVQLRKVLDLVGGVCSKPVVISANVDKDEFADAEVIAYHHDARGLSLPGKIWRQIRSQFAMVGQCRRALKEHGPFDAIIFWVGTEQFLAQLYLKLKGQRTLIYLYGTPQDIPGSGPLNKMVSLTRKWMRSLTARMAWQVAVEAPGVDLPSFAKNKAVTMPLGIDIAQLGDSDSDSDSSKANVGETVADERENIALYAGRLADCKGLVELIDAAKHADWPDGLRLVIAGDGPWADKLGQQAEGCPHIEMVGWVDGEQLRGWMQKSRFVVLPSETEGLPNALMEGMAHGAIPIATAVGGIPYLTEDFRLGQRVKEITTKGILEAVTAATQLPNPQAHADACRQSILQRFSLPISQQRMVQHLNASRHGKALILSNLLPGMSEGQSNFAKQLERKLQSHQVPVKHKNLKSALLNPLFWLGIRRYKRIHVVFRYNKRLSRFLRWLDLVAPGRVSLWALQPPLCKPRRHASVDSLFTLSSATGEQFDETGLVPHLTKCGIDLQRFQPGGNPALASGAGSSVRADADTSGNANVHDPRADFGIAADQKWVIHVGPVRENRGVRHLAEIAAQDGVKVTLISRPGSGEDPGLREFLTGVGVQVFDQYLESIEAVYHAADGMVFPTTDPSGCIELPLSVLEAVACGLPVIAAPFGGLVDHFPAGAPGLQVVADPAEIAGAVKSALLDGSQPGATMASATTNEAATTKQAATNEATAADLAAFDWNTGLDEALSTIPFRRHRKGKLIMVTGLDGAGKSTLLANLATELRSQGHLVTVPWCGYEMKLLRPLVTFAKRFVGASPERMEKDYHGYRQAMVGAINRPLVGPIYRIMVGFEYYFQMFWKVRIPLWRGQVVLADRYVHDLCVAFAANSEEDQETLNRRVRRWSRFVPTPQLKFFVDVPPEVSISRKDDIPDLEYLTSRRNRYTAMAEACGFTALDGTLTREQVWHRALAVTADEFNRGGYGSAPSAT